MKRLLATFLILLVLLFLVQLPDLIRIYLRLSSGRASGVGFVAGSPAENAFRFAVVLLLAILAYWLSGKLLRH